jgi:hypothetical protein
MVKIPTMKAKAKRRHAYARMDEFRASGWRCGNFAASPV